MKCKKINYETYLHILFLILIVVFCLWNIGILNRVKVIDDEFGYWGIAAAFAGYDWYDLLSVTGYYSFGYSFVLIPLMLLGKVGVSMALIYKLAIILNAFFMVGEYLLILYVIRELDVPLGTPLKQIASLFTTLYIGNAEQMNIAWTETYLCFMFWCIIALLVRTMKRQGYGNAFFLIAATANIFAIHMRAVGVVIAVIIVLTGWLIGHYKECGIKYIGFVIGVSGVFIIITALLKQFVSSSIYMGGNADSVNDIAANASKIRDLLSVGGIIDVSMSVLGKLYYTGAVSFMIAIVGLVLAVCLIVKALFLWRGGKKSDTSKSNKWQCKEWMLLFVFLAFMGEIGVSAIFKIFSYYSLDMTSTLADTIVFGRYSNFVVGPMLLLGVWAICHIDKYYREMIVALLFFMFCTVSVQKQFYILSFYNGSESLGIRGTAAPGLPALYRGQIDNYAFYAAGVIIIVFLIICFIRIINVQKTMLFGMTLVVISLFWGMRSISSAKTYTVVKSNKEKTVCTVQDIVDVAGKSAPVYLVSRDGASVDVKILQWCMGDQSIHMLGVEELENYDLTQGIYLVDSGDARVLGMLSDRMDYIYDSGTIAVFVSDHNVKYSEILDKAAEMGQVADPLVNAVDLAQTVTEYSYQKENGSLYYNYRATNGGYMTWETGLNPEDGIYEFGIDIRVQGVEPDSEIGYITVGDADGEVQGTYALRANDFADKDRQVIPVQVTIKDWKEPVIGVFTYGEAAIRIFGISYHKIVGNTMLDTEEWRSIADDILQKDGEAAIYYVDSNDSGTTGFPYWQDRNLKYLSGSMIKYKDSFEPGFYVVEKSNVETLELCIGQMELLQETEHYIIFASLDL